MCYEINKVRLESGCFTSLMNLFYVGQRRRKNNKFTNRKLKKTSALLNVALCYLPIK